MRRTRRWAVMLLAACVLVAMMMSLVVVACEAGHDCIGENCSICAVVALCRSVVKKITAVLIALWLVLIGGSFVVSALPVFRVGGSFKTPVSLKVELLN